MLNQFQGELFNESSVMNKIHDQYVNHVAVDILEELNVYPHNHVVSSIENILQKHIKNIKNYHNEATLGEKNKHAKLQTVLRPSHRTIRKISGNSCVIRGYASLRMIYLAFSGVMVISLYRRIYYV